MTALMKFNRRPPIPWKFLNPLRRNNWCGICRRGNPALFDVPNKVWNYYVESDQSAQVICLPCWNWLVEVTDDGAFQAQHGRPTALWSDEFRRRHGISPDEPMPGEWLAVNLLEIEGEMRRVRRVSEFGRGT